MTRRAATPTQITDILALREAGYTALAISQKLNLSVRTIHRHMAAHGAEKGKLKTDMIAKAKAELAMLVTSSTSIKEEVARLINDDIAHVKHIRNIIIEASEHLKATNPQEAMLVMRAAAAYSTTLKNTSDTIRHLLGLDKLDVSEDELPELVVREITDEDAKSMTEIGLIDD